MKRIVLPIALLALALVSRPVSAETIVTANDGGVVQDFYVEVMSHQMRKERIVIDGPCYSACTLALHLADQKLMCATPRALFGFHRAFSGKPGTPEYEDDGGWTGALEELYPAKVSAFLKARGGLSHKWILLAGDEMQAIVPMCPEGTVTPDGEDKMLVPDRKREGSSDTDAKRSTRTGPGPAPQRAR